MQYLHIGIGKSGSTWLQNIIFPKICKIKKMNFIDLRLNLKKKKFNKAINELILPKNYLISYEGMIHDNFEHYNIRKRFNLIKKKFSNDVKIILIIRKPSDFIKSLYIQRSFRECNFIDSKKFLVLRKKKTGKNTFNLKEFSYQKIIKLYKTHFTKIYVIKYENKFFLKKLTKIFKTNYNFSKYESKKILNKSLSSNTIKLMLFINKFFNIKKNNKFFLKKANLNKNNSLKEKILMYFYYYLRVEVYLRIFDNLFGNKPIEFNFGKYSKILKKLDKKYLEII
jgi:hypothetical protein